MFSLSNNTLAPISKQNKENSDSDSDSVKSSDFGGMFDQQLIDKYEEEHYEFMQHGISQKSQLIIRRLSMSKNIPYEFRIQPLFRLLIGAYQEMNLNDMEVAMWAIYIERFVWPQVYSALHYLLVITAFTVKLHMNDDVSHLREYLKTKILRFEENFTEWYAQNENNMNVSLTELNSVYTGLGESMVTSKDYMTLELNFYVDDILKNSLPYSSEARENSYDYKAEARNNSNDHIPVMPLIFPPMEVRHLNFYDNLLPPLSNPNSSSHTPLVPTPGYEIGAEFLNLTPNIPPKGKPKASFWEININ